jgi:hypothetical protein
VSWCSLPEKKNVVLPLLLHVLKSQRYRTPLVAQNKLTYFRCGHQKISNQRNSFKQSHARLEYETRRAAEAAQCPGCCVTCVRRPGKRSFKKNAEQSGQEGNMVSLSLADSFTRVYDTKKALPARRPHSLRHRPHRAKRNCFLQFKIRRVACAALSALPVVLYLTSRWFTRISTSPTLILSGQRAAGESGNT